jgi:hypothetical protein
VGYSAQWEFSMRKIRFRAWDTFNKVWVKKADGSVDNKVNPWMEQRSPQYRVMQYTGLKDKNGKEYFDEDLAKGESGAVFPIKWELSGWTWWGIPLHKVAKDLEIIGNIMENSELLK